jgi:hypothetical protein
MAKLQHQVSALVMYMEGLLHYQNPRYSTGRDYSFKKDEHESEK